MNLVGDPWIPVLSQSGQSELVSLLDLFARASELRDLAVSPPQRVAMTRLLVCVAQAALDGPADEAARQSCAPEIGPAATAYLEKQRGGFELYADGEEGAFLQLPNLEPTDNAVVDKLDFGLSAGANSTLFDHEAGPDGRNLADSARALNLLTFQCFSPGGRIGVTRWKSIWTTKDGKKPEKGSGPSEHAPCLDGSPLHTIIRRENLLETIRANFLTREMIAELPNVEWGSPCWEGLPKSATDPRGKNLASTYLGRLVPLSRAIRLTRGSNKMTLAAGLTYPKFPEIREPSITASVNKKGEQCPLPLSLEKHPWRELSSILELSDRLMEGRALVLRHLRQPAREEDAEDFDLWTGGLAADKGKVLDVADWSFTLSTSMLENTSLQRYRNGVEHANQAAEAIKAAVKIYCTALKLETVKTQKWQQAVSLFWGLIDGEYEVLLAAANDHEVPLAEEWHKTVYRQMRESYRVSCPHETPRQIQAYAQGEDKLRLKKPE